MHNAPNRVDNRETSQARTSGYSRRNLLSASTLLGGSRLLAQAVLPSPAAAQGQTSGHLNYKDVLEKARERLYPTCRVCPGWSPTPVFPFRISHRCASILISQ